MGRALRRGGLPDASLCWVRSGTGELMRCVCVCVRVCTSDSTFMHADAVSCELQARPEALKQALEWLLGRARLAGDRAPQLGGVGIYCGARHWDRHWGPPLGTATGACGTSGKALPRPPRPPQILKLLHPGSPPPPQPQTLFPPFPPQRDSLRQK